MSINLAVKPKVTPKTKKSDVVKPKAKVKAMDPKDFKGTYKYDRDAKIQVCVPKNPKREGCEGWRRFNLYKNGMKIKRGIMTCTYVIIQRSYKLLFRILSILNG